MNSACLLMKDIITHLRKTAGSSPLIILLTGSDNSKLCISLVHFHAWMKSQPFVWFCVGCSTNSSETYVVPCTNIIIYLRNGGDILWLCNSQWPVNTHFEYLEKLSTSYEITWIKRMGTVTNEGAYSTGMIRGSTLRTLLSFVWF
jgi:hypothetical protein